jgi:hypothetical protein
MTGGAFAFAPFEKGGYGGFAFALDLESKIKGKSPSIPLFQRGKKTFLLLQGGKKTFLLLQRRKKFALTHLR